MAKHNWRDLERRFLTGEFISLLDLAKNYKISYSLVRKRAATEEWIKKRAEIEHSAVAEIEQQLKIKMAREAQKRVPALLDLADALRFKALQTLSQESMRLTPTDALRAARDGANIELELLVPKAERRRDAAIETEPTSGENIIDEKPREAIERKLRRLIAGKDSAKGGEGAK